jgi:rhodanese-related sulfurtransferase
MKILHLPLLVCLCVVLLSGAYPDNLDASEEAPVSGEILGGYRVLVVPSNQNELEYTVYRGDYLKFRFERSVAAGAIQIPKLSIEQQLAENIKIAPFIKMKRSGSFEFSIGKQKGILHVIEYQQSQYRVLTTDESADFIETHDPVILDVRTQQEYRGGYIENSILLPVQELQQRIHEIDTHRNDSILIYCATGNRSTVASKILIDQGFNRIYNMKNGIRGWVQQGYSIEK